MKTALVILIVALLVWKSYYAWLRGSNAWRYDRQHHDSLREYLLGNGATERQALQPFVRRALLRAFKPLVVQWRFWVVVALLLIIILLID